MAKKNESYGLFVFLGDWIRSSQLRQRIFDTDTSFAELAQMLRQDYQLDDEDIGVIASHKRPRLTKRLGKVIKAIDLDFPPPWTGVEAPPPDEEKPAGPGWPGEMIICLETITRGGEDPVVPVGKKVTLQVTGWNINRRKLQFALNPTTTVDDAVARIKTDKIGRSKGTVRVTFPTPGKWTASLVDRDTNLSRGALPGVVTVKRS